MKPQIFRSAIVASFLFPQFTLVAGARSSVVSGIRWEFSVHDGGASIGQTGSFYGGPAIPTDTVGDIVIPSRLGGYPVTEIGWSAFSGCSEITSLSIPGSVREIGPYVFEHCTSLRSISVDSSSPYFRSSDGVLYSRDGRILVFFPPGRTGSFFVPDSVDELGSEAFAETRLSALSLPNGLRRINWCSISYGTQLETVVVPESVSAIDSAAFYGDSQDYGFGVSALKTVYLPRRFEGTTDDWSVPDGCRLVFYDPGTVSFEPEGGYVSPRSKSVVVGAEMGALPIPSRNGCRFEGWWTRPVAGGSLCLAGTKVSSVSTTLYARWSEETESPLQPIYRFYSKKYKGHFFTIDPDERATLMCTNPNWGYEGVAYYAFAGSGEPGTVALHRFYSKKYKGHFFTIDEDEMWTVRNTNPNWSYEGVAYYVYPAAVEGAVPVYRFWSKVYRHHFYTVDADEMWTVRTTNPNWSFEGFAFYARPNDEAAVASDAERPMQNGTMANGPANGGKEWTLAAEDGTPVATRGVTKTGGTLVETRGDAPEAAELEQHAESAEIEPRADGAELVFSAGGSCAKSEPAGTVRHSGSSTLHCRLTLPPGLWNASLWSAAEGTLIEEKPEGTFDFALPVSGAWHWLRVRDGEGDGDSSDAFSVWLRAE